MSLLFLFNSSKSVVSSNFLSNSILLSSNTSSVNKIDSVFFKKFDKLYSLESILMKRWWYGKAEDGPPDKPY